mgnify:CR=1 FL=1
MENKTKEAVETLCAALKEDADYYYGWQSNIAMAFIDKVYMNPTKYMDENNWEEIANKAADNFLKQLINGKQILHP